MSPSTVLGNGKWCNPLLLLCLPAKKHRTDAKFSNIFEGGRMAIKEFDNNWLLAQYLNIHPTNARRGVCKPCLMGGFLERWKIVKVLEPLLDYLRWGSWECETSQATEGKEPPLLRKPGQDSIALLESAQCHKVAGLTFESCYLSFLSFILL